MDVRLRPVEVGDRHRLASISRTAILFGARSAYSAAQLEAWADGVQADSEPFEDSTTVIRVAEVDGRPAGFGWVRPGTPAYLGVDVDGELGALYVSPEVSGRGIGTRLYERLETLAATVGISSLGLWASRNAIGFYRRHGFEPVARRPLVTDVGITLPVLEMYKELG